MHVAQHLRFAPLQLQENLELLNAFPAGVVICDSNGLIRQVNDILLELFSYTKDQLLGQSINVLLPEEHQSGHVSHLVSYMSNPEKRIMGQGRELYGRRRDGSTFPVEIGLNPVLTLDGTKVLATVADITQRRRMERDFHSIVEAAPVGMLIIGRDGRIVHANSHLMRIFGYSLEELSNQPMEILLPERYRHGHLSQRNSFLHQPATRSMGLNRDLTGLHKAGFEVPVEIGLNPMESENGQQVIAVVSDISERRRNELRLNQLLADLEEFSYVASHDLRSPLRGISDLVEWIEEDLGEASTEPVHNNLVRIRTRLQRMDKLVDDLLIYAKSGIYSTDYRDVDLRELLKDIVQFIDPPDTFRIDLRDVNGIMQCSPTPLETVLRNLISNAIKHHDRNGGEIRVSTRFKDSYCIFEIEDDGPGIPPNAHPRIFKLFQSLSRKERSGIGLAVCRRLVEGHGGKIGVRSDANMRGTCFHFTWPRFARSDLIEKT